MKKSLGNYLYLLPFKNKMFFKIGISSNDISRILYLNRLYDLDLTNSLIIKGDNKIIKHLERELLLVFPKRINGYEENDGHTEIRKIKYFTQVVDIINIKKSYIDLNILKLTDVKVKNIESNFNAKFSRRPNQEEIISKKKKEQKFKDIQFLFQSETFKETFDSLINCDNIEKILHYNKNMTFRIFFKSNITDDNLYNKLTIQRNGSFFGSCFMYSTSERTPIYIDLNFNNLKNFNPYDREDLSFIILDIYNTILNIYENRLR